MKVIALGLFLVLSQLSLATERYGIQSFNESGFGCNDSTQKALADCQQWLNEFSASHALVATPSCSLQNCYCSYGSQITNTTCLGGALYEDHASCEGTEQFQYHGETASGFGCGDAQEKAISALGDWATTYSTKVPVTGLTPPTCSCSGGQIANASCSATARYLQCP